jgi:hypothetical protein
MIALDQQMQSSIYCKEVCFSAKYTGVLRGCLHPKEGSLREEKQARTTHMGGRAKILPTKSQT